MTKKLQIEDFSADESWLDYYLEDGVVCPYCKNESYYCDDDLWEALPYEQEEETTVTCPKCNEEFVVVCANITYSYQTYRLKKQ